MHGGHPCPDAHKALQRCYPLEPDEFPVPRRRLPGRESPDGFPEVGRKGKPADPIRRLARQRALNPAAVVNPDVPLVGRHVGEPHRPGNLYRVVHEEEYRRAEITHEGMQVATLTRGLAFLRVEHPRQGMFFGHECPQVRQGGRGPQPPLVGHDADFLPDQQMIKVLTHRVSIAKMVYVSTLAVEASPRRLSPAFTTIPGPSLNVRLAANP